MFKSKTGLPKSEGNRIDAQKIKSNQNVNKIRLQQETERSRLESGLLKQGLHPNDSTYQSALHEQERQHEDALNKAKKPEGK